MIDKNSFQKIHRKLREGNISRSEYDQFLEFVNADDNNEFIKDLLTDQFAEYQNVSGSTMESDDSAVLPLRPRRYIGQLLKIAAVLVLVSAFGWGLWKFRQPTAGKVYHYATTDRPSELIILPDSSQVKLNSYSEINYSVSENGERSINLKGEAYFDVKHTVNNRAFLVKTATSSIRVLGTAFNVNNREEMDEVFLERGSIELKRNGKSESQVVLKPGEAGIIAKTGIEIAISHSDNFRNEASWRDGLLRFSGVKLSDIVVRLNEIYHKDIRINKSGLLDSQMELTLPYGNWEVTSSALALSLGLKVKDNGDHVDFNP